jgi:non-heme chloroperoxidase
MNARRFLARPGYHLLTLSTLVAAFAGAALTPAAPALAASAQPAVPQASSAQPAGTYITTRDGVQLYYKDWGPRNGQPIVFSHGWPLNSDSWESQMLFLADQGYRVIAHDRRGHGRSSQPWEGNDMDHYADDLATVIDTLQLKNAVLVGFSTGGEGVTWSGRQLVGAGHAGWAQEHLRLDQGVLRIRHDRGPEEDRSADPGHPW